MNIITKQKSQKSQYKIHKSHNILIHFVTVHSFCDYHEYCHMWIHFVIWIFILWYEYCHKMNPHTLETNSMGWLWRVVSPSSVLQRVAVCCSVLQCVAVCCSAAMASSVAQESSEWLVFDSVCTILFEFYHKSELKHFSICTTIEWAGVDIRWVSMDGFDTRWIPRSFSCGLSNPQNR